MFEVSDYVLKRDSGSLLSQLCDANPPVMMDPNGVFYFDRDWWLFRYILIFLRDGALPQDRNLLAQLYVYSYYAVLLSPFLPFLVCDVLSLSSYQSITVCLHSLTPHGTSLTIIPYPPQSIINDTHTHITYCYLTGTGRRPFGT
jgi:hypothetical protein